MTRPDLALAMVFPHPREHLRLGTLNIDPHNIWQWVAGRGNPPIKCHNRNRDGRVTRSQLVEFSLSPSERFPPISIGHSSGHYGCRKPVDPRGMHRECGVRKQWLESDHRSLS
jgi:hypothetical protein